MMKFDDMLSSGERREPVGARGIHIPQKKMESQLELRSEFSSHLIVCSLFFLQKHHDRLAFDTEMFSKTYVCL